MLWSIGGRSRLVRLLGVGLGIVILINLLLWDTSGRCTSSDAQHLQRQVVSTDLNGTEFIMDNRKYILLEDSIMGRRLSDHHYLDDLEAGANHRVAGGPLQMPNLGQGMGTKVGSVAEAASLQKHMITDLESTKSRWPWGDLSDICANVSYDLPTLAKTSVIIAFADHEHVSNVLHTIHSILQRTPQVLLQEIILIDDNTKKDDLKEILGNYIEAVFPEKVRLIRSDVHLGLIKARLMGARLARGQVVVSMDSHMEVQDGWLEPLLYEIYKDRGTLAASYLDWMEYDNMGGFWRYTHGASTWKTYFDWTFVFGFQDMSWKDRELQDKQPTKAVPSPVTIGTIWAIEKQFFFDIGAFDPGMEGWGGENLDFAIRVWLFGGRVVNVPCSHAGHFESPGSRDYRRGWERMIHKNYKRVAEVWMPHHKRYLYYFHPHIQDLEVGNLTDRMQLKTKAKHDFSWFLLNVFPELGFMDKSRSLGGVRNLGSSRCLEAVPLGSPYMGFCVRTQPIKQGFYWNFEGQLRFPVHIFNSKLDGNFYRLNTQEFIPAYQHRSNTRWYHWKGGPLIDSATKKCLQDKDNVLSLVTCDFFNSHQQWLFNNYTSHYNALTEEGFRGETKFLQTLSKMTILAHNQKWELLEKTLYNVKVK